VGRAFTRVQVFVVRVGLLSYIRKIS
jgi:hypothetical protein